MGFFEKWKKDREKKRQEQEKQQKEMERQQRELKYQQKRQYRFPTIDFRPLPGCQQFEYSVVGESYRKKDIASIGIPNPDYKLDKGSLYRKGLFEKTVYAYTFPNITASLEPEPTNKHDPNAVKVIVNGVHVGYIKSAEAPGIKRRLESGEIHRIQCSIRGGDNRMIHTDGQYFEGKVPISELRIDRETNDFSVTLFIDVPESTIPDKKKRT